MNLKKLVLELLMPDQLKQLCVEFDLEADRRSREAMVAALASAKRAKAERLVELLTVPQLRDALGQCEQPTAGKREELVLRLFEAGGRAWPMPPAREAEAQFETPAGGWSSGP